METRRFYTNSVAEGLIQVRDEMGAEAVILSVEEKECDNGATVEIVAGFAEDDTPSVAESVVTDAPARKQATTGNTDTAVDISPEEIALLTQGFTEINPDNQENLMSERKTAPAPQSQNDPADDANDMLDAADQAAELNMSDKLSQIADMLEDDNLAAIAKMAAEHGADKTEKVLANLPDSAKKPARRRMRPRRTGLSKQPKSQVKQPVEVIGSDRRAEPTRPFSPHSVINQTAPMGTPDMFLGGGLPKEVAELYFYLVDTGINREIAEELVERVVAKFPPNKGWRRDKIRQFMCQLVQSQISVGGQFGAIKKRRIAALIGPTGVGKTTTAAKLAAILTRRGVSVGMITLDQFRVAAVDQLRKYTETLRVPLLAATNKRDFDKALRGLRSRQVVLIDTSGQNPQDRDIMERLHDILGIEATIERHLVLSAQTKERDLEVFVELYRRIGFDYLLFSKLDETSTYGGMLNTYFAADRPFSYFTTGQRVPDDIEEADHNRLNDFLFR